MSLDDDEKKFYFVKLPEDFFNDKVMKRLRKLPGGDVYTIIALKILLLGLRDGNRIYFDRIGTDFADEIALSIDEQPEAVQVTISYLLQCGWLEQVDDDTLYSPKGAEMTGSITSRGLRKQRQKEREKTLEEQSSAKVPLKFHQSSAYIDIDKEKEIEKEKEIDIETETRKSWLSNGQPSDNQWSAQNSIGKDSKEEGSIPLTTDTANAKQTITSVNNYNISNSNIDYSFYQDKWNEICTSLPKCTIMSDKRKKAVKACLNVFSEEKIIEAFRMAEESDFLSGRNGAWNGCGIDWVLVTGNMTKILEGNYKNKTSGGNPDMATSTDYSQYVEVIHLGE